MSKAGKTISMSAMAPRKIPPAADAWVASRAGGVEPDKELATVTQLPKAADATPKERMTRFTIDVPESLHRRVKMECAGRGLRMADVLREMLEREFPVKA